MAKAGDVAGDVIVQGAVEPAERSRALQEEVPGGRRLDGLGRLAAGNVSGPTGNSCSPLTPMGERLVARSRRSGAAARAG